MRKHKVNQSENCRPQALISTLFSRCIHAPFTLACYSVGMNDGYLAYLLRIWRVGAAEGEGAIWRASLEDPHTGEVRAFGSLAALVAFLEDAIGSQPHTEAVAGNGYAPPDRE